MLKFYFSFLHILLLIDFVSMHLYFVIVLPCYEIDKINQLISHIHIFYSNTTYQMQDRTFKEQGIWYEPSLITCNHDEVPLVFCFRSFV